MASLSMRFAIALCAAILPRSEGHGHMFWPPARNKPKNGVTSGGPGTVHSFVSGAHAKYQHGVCGNAPGEVQTYNRVGDVSTTLQAGSVADIRLLITAHHVGYFELELCLNAGQLSESCFMQHRLLRHGCTCKCPDATNSCEACHVCRRWWKPILDGESSQVVTTGYKGPVLPGKGNTVAYEFVLQYDIPANIKTSRGVLRWHYMTTNSCTSKSSSPEEFWNCADVRIVDVNSNAGAPVTFDNSFLESMTVENLMPDINANLLKGINSACPEDSTGQLLGVGTEEDYKDLCGLQDEEGKFERCVTSIDGSSASSAACNQTLPPTGILCPEECGDFWIACAHNISYMKSVPKGTKCRAGSFVLEASCVGFSFTTTTTTPNAAMLTSTVGSPITTATNSLTTTSESTPTLGSQTTTSKGFRATTSTSRRSTKTLSPNAQTSSSTTTVFNPCNPMPSRTVLCESDCGEWWYHCSHGIAYRKGVPGGTKCRDGEFVHAANCQIALSADSTPALLQALATNVTTEFGNAATGGQLSNAVGYRLAVALAAPMAVELLLKWG